MLVLSRKVGERILVPECGLSITVVAVQGKTVRLGIAAPADIDIFREEIWHQAGEPTHRLPANR
jgi:carbon storage regulator